MWIRVKSKKAKNKHEKGIFMKIHQKKNGS
jgi:hypothetical protein